MVKTIAEMVKTKKNEVSEDNIHFLHMWDVLYLYEKQAHQIWFEVLCIKWFKNIYTCMLKPAAGILEVLMIIPLSPLTTSIVSLR